jgi:hypothetical protein
MPDDFDLFQPMPNHDDRRNTIDVDDLRRELKDLLKKELGAGLQMQSSFYATSEKMFKDKGEIYMIRIAAAVGCVLAMLFNNMRLCILAPTGLAALYIIFVMEPSTYWTGTKGVGGSCDAASAVCWTSDAACIFERANTQPRDHCVSTTGPEHDVLLRLLSEAAGSLHRTGWAYSPSECARRIGVADQCIRKSLMPAYLRCLAPNSVF